MFKLLATAFVMVSTRKFGSSSCANFWVCASRPTDLSYLLINFMLPLLGIFWQLRLSWYRWYHWGSSLYCCCLRANFSQPAVATKSQCQSTLELGEGLRRVRGLQHTMSNSCIIVVMQLMGILVFQLLICFCTEGWFVGDDFPDQNLEVICKGILQFILLLVPNCRSH